MLGILAGRRQLSIVSPDTKIAIEAVVGVLEKSPRPTVTPLGHVVGKTGKDSAGEAGHPGSLALMERAVN